MEIKRTSQNCVLNSSLEHLTLHEKLSVGWILSTFHSTYKMCKIQHATLRAWVLSNIVKTKLFIGLRKKKSVLYSRSNWLVKFLGKLLDQIHLQIYFHQFFPFLLFLSKLTSHMLELSGSCSGKKNPYFFWKITIYVCVSIYI